VGRTFKAVGAIISGVVIVASYIYVDNQSDAIAMLAPVILTVFGIEIAAFLYFLFGALWKRKSSGEARISED
jgi:hypothetical protein